MVAMSTGHGMYSNLLSPNLIKCLIIKYDFLVPDRANNDSNACMRWMFEEGKKILIAIFNCYKCNGVHGDTSQMVFGRPVYGVYPLTKLKRMLKWRSKGN